MATPDFGVWADRTLGGILLFCGVEEDALITLGAQATWHDLPSGRMLMREGDVRRTFFALVRGTLHCHTPGMTPNEVVEAGSVVGLRLALCGQLSDMNVVTRSAALVAEIELGDLLHALTVSPAIATNFAQFVVGRGEGTEARRQLDARVARALICAAGESSDGRFVALEGAVNPTVWATLLGTDAIDLRRSLERLQRAGLIRGEPLGRLRVDVAGLRRRFG